MKKLSLFLMSLLLNIGIVQANIKIEAPLGLSWGMTQEDMEKANVELEILDSISGFKLFYVLETPNQLIDFPEIIVVVSDEYGLVRVLLNSRTIENDPMGTEGKRFYNNYKAILEEKYGKPSFSGEMVGITFYEKADEFYQCLDYAGCGVYGSIFGDPEEELDNITISINGTGRGEGYVKLVYSSNEFKKHRAKERDKENKKAKSLL